MAAASDVRCPVALRQIHHAITSTQLVYFGQKARQLGHAPKIHSAIALLCCGILPDGRLLVSTLEFIWGLLGIKDFGDFETANGEAVSGPVVYRRSGLGDRDRHRLSNI
jgi:hypothetical protein